MTCPTMTPEHFAKAEQRAMEEAERQERRKKKMTDKLKYYKPKTLTFGILLFGISLGAFGYMIGSTINAKYLWLLILSIIGFLVGEGLICEASSYKIKDKKEND